MRNENCVSYAYFYPIFQIFLFLPFFLSTRTQLIHLPSGAVAQRIPAPSFTCCTAADSDAAARLLHRG